MEALAPLPTTSPATNSPLPRSLQYELWRRMVERLNHGESLITIDHFQRAMEAEYLSLTQTAPSEATRGRIRRMIARVHEIHPEIYLVNGVQNGITSAFHKGANILQWTLADVQEKGTRTIKRFLRGNIRNFLQDLGVDAPMIDPLSCVRSTSTKMVEDQNRQKNPASVQVTFGQSAGVLSFPQPGLPPEKAWSDVPTAPSLSAETTFTPGVEVQEAVQQGLLDAEEARERRLDQGRNRAEIRQQELARIPENLDSYEQRDLLTEQEARNLRTIYTGESKLKKADIQHIREKLEAKIKSAVAPVVHYLDIFEALKRIPEERDDALKFLIHHKDLVTATNKLTDLAPAIRLLEEDPHLLQDLLAIMDRTDQEIRMISLRLPPYDRLVPHDEMDHLAIEEEFIDDLRTLDKDQLSALLNSPDSQIRIRPATDIKCLIALVDHLVTLTRFCQEVRILRIVQTLKDLYHSTGGARKGRDKVEQFLNHRLGYLFPDLTPYERAIIEQRSSAVVQDAAQETPAKHRVAEAKPGKRKNLQLEEDEVALGVQIARVAVRVAGKNKRVLYKIMEDPEDAGKYYMVQRDFTSGKIIPALRRGSKRYVEKNRKDFWKLAK